MLAGRLVLNPMFRLIGRLGERELFVVAGLFTVIAASALMHALGLSVALGAFIAGVMLAESPYRHELESDVEPFRSILLGLFFLSVGMMLDLSAVAQRPGFVIGIALAVIVIKSLIIAALARSFGNGWPRSIRLGLLISQAGEFGFVLFAQADAARLILPEAASLFSAVVVLSMMTTPFLMRLTDWMERREETSARGLAGPEESPETSVIVVGYGRFGQTVAQMLMAKRVGVTLIDKTPSMIETAGEFGTKVYYGDGMRIDLLRTAGAETAKAILFCNDNRDEGMTRAALKRVLEAFPQAAVLVRVFDRRHLMSARRARPCICPARAVRKRGGDGPQGAEGGRGRRRARSTGSTANIGCAIASGSSGRARPATSTPARSEPSAPDRSLPDEAEPG